MRLTRPAFIVNASVLLLFMLLGLTSGLAGALLLGGFYALVVLLVAWLTGRGEWLGLRSRRVSALACALAFAVVVTGGALLPTDEVASSELVAEEGTPSPTADEVDLDNVEVDLTDTGEEIEDLEAAAPANYSASGRTQLTRATAAQILDELPVREDSSLSDYDRELFGDGWQDLDEDGCTTRNEILSRDLSSVRTSDSCIVESGTLADPYTGTAIDFVRGEDTSAAVQIAHLVTPAQAWRSGAAELSATQRVELANDPINLLAVDGPARESQASGDASTWLPPVAEFRCEYVARQVSVKASYDLSVTEEEQAVLADVLETCPEQKGYRSKLAPLTEPKPEPSPTTAEPTTEAPRPSTAPPAEPAPEPEPEEAQPEPAAPAEPEPEEESAQRTGITPGAWCKRVEVGDIATGKNGKTYRCVEEGNKGRWKPV